jgi:hypothetical protein
MFGLAGGDDGCHFSIEHHTILFVMLELGVPLGAANFRSFFLFALYSFEGKPHRKNQGHSQKQHSSQQHIDSALFFCLTSISIPIEHLLLLDYFLIVFLSGKATAASHIPPL